MYSVLLEPESSKAYHFLLDKIYKELVVIFANCEVWYKGRAESKASISPRLIIIKPDGTVIVHESVKREPLNWQPPGTRIRLTETPLIVHAERQKPKEVIEILLNKIYYITTSKVENGDFIIKGREIDIVDSIIKEPYIIEDGFKPIEREYKTPYGKVDLIGVDKEGKIVVIEVKRSKAQLQAVSQLYRYYIYFREMNGDRIRGILVAPDITQHAMELLLRLGLEFKKYSIEGTKILI